MREQWRRVRGRRSDRSNGKLRLLALLLVAHPDGTLSISWQSGGYFFPLVKKRACLVCFQVAKA